MPRLHSVWRGILFNMLEKTAAAKTTNDFRAIACLRTLYKLIAYMILGRIEHTLEDQQPEEQHGFRAGRRLEEHIISANIIMQKTWAIGRPVWIASLDLSKAFDRLAWTPLWRALEAHGVSNHMIWLIQNVYCNQTGGVVCDSSLSHEFGIRAGIRQGRALNARLFSSALAWGAHQEHPGHGTLPPTEAESDGEPGVIRLSD